MRVSRNPVEIKNLGPVERSISLAAGTALVAYGMKKRSAQQRPAGPFGRRPGSTGERAGIRRCIICWDANRSGRRRAGRRAFRTGRESGSIERSRSAVRATSCTGSGAIWRIFPAL